MPLNFAKIAMPVKLAALSASLLCCGMVTWAASPADTIAARQANFKQMGKGMKAISDQIRSPAPAIDEIKAGALAIDQAAGKVDGYFPQGTGPESGVKTGALPAIWARNGDFRADAARLVKAAAALHAAADSGNVDQVKAAFAAVGGTCKDCHQDFRAREN